MACLGCCFDSFPREVSGKKPEQTDTCVHSPDPINPSISFHDKKVQKSKITDKKI